MTARDDLADAFVTASRALIGVAVHSVNTARIDITVTQYRLLVLVSESDRSVGDIAEHLGVNQSNASRHCDRLQRLGLVERRRSGADARIVFIALTDQGRALVEEVTARRREEVRRLLDAIPVRDARALIGVLEVFNRAALEQDHSPWLRDPW